VFAIYPDTLLFISVTQGRRSVIYPDTLLFISGTQGRVSVIYPDTLSFIYLFNYFVKLLIFQAAQCQKEG